MTEGAQIVAIGRQPNPDVVKALELLLEQAKAGEIVSLAYIGHSPDYSVRFGHFRPDGMKQTTMIGAIGFLEFKLCQDMDDGS